MSTPGLKTSCHDHPFLEEELYERKKKKDFSLLTAQIGETAPSPCPARRMWEPGSRRTKTCSSRRDESKPAERTRPCDESRTSPAALVSMRQLLLQHATRRHDLWLVFMIRTLPD
ncbi:hypothetical protein M426DRAFT_156268 [Hypoxylon sp. CI-4A]|nr:hypothetical protein M426DRAFT_156268 [Hypoxylon sp. CI-4A]